MALSYEWTVYYLTPNGWVEGSSKWDFGYKEVEPPADRVLSRKYSEELSNLRSGVAKDTKDTNDIWRSDNDAMIKDLLDKYGDCPNII
jgi:hypothetical protein